jgi:multidrug efflux pump subunit AcrA (membrane-fusion protein)
VEQFAALARTPIELPDFVVALVDHLLSVLPASGALVRTTDRDGHALATLVGRDFPPTLALPGAGYGELAMIEAIRVGTSTVACAYLPDGEERALAVYLLLLPDTTAEEVDGALRLMKVFAEVVEDYLQRRELAELRAKVAADHDLSQLLLRLHASLDPLTTAYTIANDGRRWLQCERVSVARYEPGGRAKVLAISGVDTVDARAEDVRRLAELCTTVARLREPVHWTGQHDEQCPPQLCEALDAYVDRSHAQRLSALPLSTAVVVVEWRSAQAATPALRSRIDLLAEHGRVAWERAVEHDLPLLGWFERLEKAKTLLRRRWAWASLLMASIAALALGLYLIPADFQLAANGVLQPRLRKHLFAPADGIVERVAVEHGDSVARGAELLTLRDVQLDLEFSRVSGDLQTTQSRLAAIRAKRSSRAPSDDEESSALALAAEEEQLKQKIDGLEAQLQVLAAMKAELTVVSPLDGQVLTWQAHDLLAARPVKRGQLLLTIAQGEGPWELELRLPDADAGHLLRAQQARQHLPVTFLLATDPAQSHHGIVERVALDVDASDGRAPSVLVTVKLDGPALDDARAGAGVIARIDCGRRSIGYVWLHDLIDAVRSKLLF